MKVFYNDEVAKIYYHSDLDALFLEYKAKVPNDDYFMKVNTETLNAFLSLNTNAFVADVRKMGILSVNAQKWIVEVMLQKMADHLKGKHFIHLQIIDATETLSKISAGNIRYKSRNIVNGFEVLQFGDNASLETYLKEVKQNKV